MTDETRGSFSAGQAAAGRFMDALLKGDLDEVAKGTTEDFYWYWSSTLPSGGVTKGIKNVFENLFAGADRLYEPGSRTVTVMRQYFGENFAVYETQVTGRTAKGRDYKNRFLFLLEVKN